MGMNEEKHGLFNRLLYAVTITIQGRAKSFPFFKVSLDIALKQLGLKTTMMRMFVCLLLVGRNLGAELMSEERGWVLSFPDMESPLAFSLLK